MASASHADVMVQPRVALALLEALRTNDTPAEILEAEDFSQSLPRRLGLSAVIARQIQRYEALAKQNRQLEASEVVDLFRLISRRPDAGDIFRRAGEELAEQELRGRSVLARGTVRILPDFAARTLALRRLRRLAAAVNPAAGIRSERKPASLIVEGSLPAYACESTEGCRVLVSPVQLLLSSYLGLEAEAVHPLCEARGDSACVWRLQQTGPASGSVETKGPAASQEERAASQGKRERQPEAKQEPDGGEPAEAAEERGAEAARKSG